MTAGSSFAEGRRLLKEGRAEIALEQFAAAADEDADPGVRAAAMAHAAEINLDLERPHEALVWAERLREEAGTPDQADLLAARAEVRLGNGEAALALLDDIVDPNTAYHTYDAAFVPLLRCDALAAAGRTTEAVEAALATAQRYPGEPAAWRILAQLISDDGKKDVDISAAVEALSEESLPSAAGGLVDAPVAGAERLADALWQRWPGDTRLLALMATIGHRLPVPSALEWSARMRAVGHGEHCPLLGVAASSDRHPRERVRAAAAAGRTFTDKRARGLLELATTAVADEEITEAFDEVLSLAPDFADSFVVAASRTGRRALVVAAALDAAGNTDAAMAVARHAAELTTGQPHVWSAAVLAAFDDVDGFARRAEEHGAEDLAAALRSARS